MVIMAKNKARLTDDQKVTFGFPVDREYARIFHPRIIIIGAGAAGLAAAQRLAENEFTDIVILEAQDRIGGRVWSQKIGNGHVEMGAQFIHGKNILYDVAEQNKLIKVITPHKKKEINPTEEHGSGGEFLVDNGVEMSSFAKIIFSETYEAITDIWRQAKSGGTLTLGLASDEEKENVGKFMRDQFDRYLLTRKYDSDDVKCFRMSIFGWLMRVHRADNACQSLHDLDVTEYAKYTAGLECIPIDVPMMDILKLAVLKNSRSKTFLSKPVEKVCFVGEKANFPIRVLCKDGDVFEADHCIVTASLGFLKHNVEKFFEPSLSAEKVDAVKKAGFGTVNKIFLQFGSAFWEDKYGDTEGFQLLFSNVAQEDLEHRMHNQPWHRAILGFDVCRTLPNSLIGWVSGTQAEEMETMTDEEVAEDCQRVLQSFLSTLVVPRPVRVIRTAWFHNQYVRGSYSHAAKNQSKHIKVLAEPDWHYDMYTLTLSDAPNSLQQRIPALLFAGEATHSTLFSTVPGAIESGHREAERIIVLYTKT
ncbi:hypothetical protein RvY_00916 [Ramazzottius varieornatus]|uniref:Amine oxidase domain-containing protein n=1 Tax=Ramazzottius varieornatus TaxID=947166 RepID=A0A1D1UI35_RAMVA|nr:hypothetical protein RvY_00916 [Ramazzottius varieornatus]